LTKPDGLDYFLLITADRLRADPTRELTPTRVEAHRRNVAAEIQRAADGTWGWAVKNALQAGTFGAQFPYGHHLYGSEAETADVSADDLVRWFRANVRPENSTLLVVGRFDTSNARAVIQRDFSDIPGGQRPPRQVLTGAPQPRLTDAVSIKGSRNYVFVNWPVLKWWSDETASLILLQHILTERLGRSRPPFVAQASAETEFWELSGRFGLMAEFARASDRSRVEVWLRSELIRINADGVSDAELERARESEVAAIRTELARIGWEESRTELLGEGLVFADDPGAYLQMLSREQAVTSVSIKAVAARRLATSGFSLAVFGGAIPSP
jgi:predicted Zn-dependent peptidase